MTAPTTAHFLTDIEIKEFKCFKDFKASGFKRVNLIGGKNNVGKTAFMEACYINVQSTSINKMTTAIHDIKFMRENINLFQKIAIEKEINSIEILDATKKNHSISNKNNAYFKISNEDAKKEYKYNINEDKKIINFNEFHLIFERDKNIHFIDNFGWTDNEIAEAYESVQRHDQEGYLSELVREFDESIDSFKLIGGTKPQCKTNNEWRDITEFGDGLKHYISIICALYACENGYLFIDEIDNGIYYDQLDRLWEIIFTLSKKTNCQIFATTHSKEMLESFARVAKKLDEQDISFTTLVKNKNQEIKALTRDYEMILDSIEDGREVR